MTTMLERIARAIYEIDASSRGCAVDWAEFYWTPNMRAKFFPMARAALLALKSPSEGLLAEFPRHLDMYGPESFLEAFVDAALSEADRHPDQDSQAEA